MRRFRKSTWALALVPVILSAILTAIYDAIKDKPILSTLWIWIKTFCSWVVSFLNFELKVWWVLLGIALIIFVLFIIIKLSENTDKFKPEFASYKEDIFAGWKWSWEWHFNTYKGSWQVDNLQAHCPECDTPMFHDDYDRNFQCPRCGFRTDCFSEHKNRHEVEAIIIDNVNRKTGKNTWNGSVS